MATCIADLLNAIDDELAASTPLDPADAAAALAAASKVVTDLRAEGLEPDRNGDRGIATHGLAIMAKHSAALFSQNPGRATALVSVLGDLSAKLRDELTQSDRWETVIRLSSTARECGRMIADSGPYDHIAELQALDRSASNLRRLAASSPPDRERCVGLLRPIPDLGEARDLRPADALYESTAGLLDEIRRLGREPLTTREMLAVCRAAEHAGRVIDTAMPDHDLGSPSDAWRVAAEELAQFRDGRTPGGTERAIVLAIATREAGNRLLRLNPADLADIDLARLRRTAALLPEIASGLDHELVVRRRWLYVPVGDTPLREERVIEFLRRTPFAADRDDLKTLHDALDTAERNTTPWLRREVLAITSPTYDLHVPLGR